MTSVNEPDAASCFMRSVAWAPGQARFTVMPSSKRSCAAVLAHAHKPVRAMFDNAKLGIGCLIDDDVMKHIRPHPAARMCGNAGGPPAGRALEVSDEGIEAAVNANLTSSVRLARSALPHMRAAGWGRMCFITSSSIKQPIPGLSLSNLARTGLWAWAKTAAQDVIDEGITINLACPGLHDTDRIRALYAEGDVPSRIGDPLDFGRVVAFLCSEPAKFISGSAVQVDGAGVVGLL